MLFRYCLLACLVLPAAAAAGAFLPGHARAAAPDADTAHAVSVMESRVQALHDRLHITAGQEPQWTALAGAMLDNARHVATLHERQAGRAEDAPAELQHYVAVAQAHAEDAARLVAPFAALYASMSHEQQLQADQTFRQFEQGRVRKTGW